MASTASSRGSGLSGPGLFDASFRQAFLEWVVRERGKTNKSATEYFYQLADVTKTIFEQEGLPAPDPPLTQAGVQEFVLAHADTYTAIVLQRKRAGKKLSFLEHAKSFLGLKSLALPPRKDPKPVNAEFRQHFLGFLGMERGVEGHKTAAQHWYSTLEFARRLHRRLNNGNGSGGDDDDDGGSEAPPPASAASSVAGGTAAGTEDEDGEEDVHDDDDDDNNDGKKKKTAGAAGAVEDPAMAAFMATIDRAGLRALVEASAARGQLQPVLDSYYEQKHRRRQASFLPHLRAYLDLPCLLVSPPAPPLPPRPPAAAADRGPLNPALKGAFMAWLQEARCVSGKTAQQYAREVGRVLARAVEEDASLRAAEAEGLLAGLLRSSSSSSSSSIEEDGAEEKGEGVGPALDKAAVAAVVAAHLPALARAEAGLQKRMRGWGTFKEFLGLLPPSASEAVEVDASSSVALEDDGEDGGQEEEEAEEGEEAAAPAMDEDGDAEAEAEAEAEGPPPASPPPEGKAAVAGKGKKRPRPPAAPATAATATATAAASASKRRASSSGARCIPACLTPQLQAAYGAWLAANEAGEEEAAMRVGHVDVASKLVWRVFRRVHPWAPLPTSTVTVPAAGEGAGEGVTAREEKGLDQAAAKALLLGHERALRRVERLYPSMRGAFAPFYRFVTGVARDPEAVVEGGEEEESDRDVKAEAEDEGWMSEDDGEEEEGDQEEEAESIDGVELSPDDGMSGSASVSVGAAALFPVVDSATAADVNAGSSSRNGGGLPAATARVKREAAGAGGAPSKRPRGQGRGRGRGGKPTPGERLAAMEAELAGLRRENDRLADQLLVARRRAEEAGRAAALREAELLRRIEELGGGVGGPVAPGLALAGCPVQQLGGFAADGVVTGAAAAAAPAPLPVVGPGDAEGGGGGGVLPAEDEAGQQHHQQQQHQQQHEDPQSPSAMDAPAPPPLPPPVVPLPDLSGAGARDGMGLGEIHV